MNRSAHSQALNLSSAISPLMSRIGGWQDHNMYSRDPSRTTFLELYPVVSAVRLAGQAGSNC